MSTRCRPLSRAPITDPDSGTASARKLDTTTGTTGAPSAILDVHNLTDAVAYFTLAASDTAGIPISAGGVYRSPPVEPGVDAWVYGLGAGTIGYVVWAVISEG
jgi:hypothetical protein